MTLYTLEYLFVYYIWPYTVFFIVVCLLLILLSYIIYKVSTNNPKTRYKSILKKCTKLVLCIYFIPIIILLLFDFLLPKQTDIVAQNIYQNCDHICDYVFSWLFKHQTVAFLLYVLFISLIIYARTLQKNTEILNKKKLFVYFLVAILISLLLTGFIILMQSFDLLTIIVLIGLPGALISFL